jgi:ribonuclease D
MNYQIVKTEKDLQEFCAQASQADAIAVDTEFVRTRTLYPRLGLIQIYDGVSLVLIDPLAIADLKPLVDLLANEKVVKVLHSCSEDLETFWHSLKVIPTPIFDSQFAACLLNMGATLGYANLVEVMLDEKLDKGESRTDWIARPLSEQQCQYAANDVFYLLNLYPTLRDGVIELNRLEWIYQEMAQLAVKKATELPAELAYLGMKNNWKLSSVSLYTLVKLAAWRIQQARQRDIALNFVVRESNLVEVARTLPSSRNELFSIDGMTPQEIRVNGDALITLVAQCRNATVEQYPPRVERLIEHSSFKKVSTAIRALCQEVADSLNVPVEILGSKKQVSQLLKWLWFDLDEGRLMGIRPDLIRGWRAPLLQKGIELIVQQKIDEQA